MQVENPVHPVVARIRNYDECHDGDVAEAANTIERLVAFIRDRVADRSTMLQARSGYHARRICLEAEELLRNEYARQELEVEK
jgi:hypothetical protein